MERESVTVGFLSYKPKVYQFMYNVSCQLAITFLFTEVAPVVVKDIIGFLIYKQIDVSRFEAYRALDSILNNNINNFIDRYGVHFELHFEKELKLLKSRTLEEYYFMFAINDRVLCNEQCYLRRVNRKIFEYSYVLRSPIVPTYSLKDPTPSAETINLDESLLETNDRRARKEKKETFRILLSCILSLNNRDKIVLINALSTCVKST